MLVVHGMWLPGPGLIVWAEDSTLAPHAPRRPGRAPRDRPHPFAAGHPALVALLAETAEPTGLGTVLLRLPTRAGSPLDSPELIRTAAVAPVRGPVTLAGWRVPVLAYAPDAALSLLRTLDGLAAAPGASLRHLVELAAFAVDLAARGRVLPGLADAGTATRSAHNASASAAGRAGVAFSTGVADRAPGAAPARRAVPARAAVATDGGTRACAVWRPLLTGTDAAWARSLALALPPAARAVVETDLPAMVAGSTEAPGPLVAAGLDALTDAAVRAALPPATLARGVRPNGAVTAWLNVLTGPHREFTADPAALRALRSELDAWQRDAAGGAVRASFRLVEPPSDEITAPLTVVPADPDALAPAPQGWRVEFGLRTSDGPGRHVDAGQVWRGEDVDAFGDQPQETLLAELGRASRLWPELDAALRTATPQRLELDAEGAHRFLREGAPTLHAAGFTVLLPSWWRRPASRLGARLRASSRTAPGTVAGPADRVGLDALVDYRWELALGDEPLTSDELARLAELKTPLVRLRGRWVELDQKRLATGLRLLRSTGELTVVDLLRLGLADAEQPDALPVLEVTADGQLGDLLAGAVDRRLAPLQEPPSFQGTLRPYQRRGLAWLAFLQSLGLGGVLADDMGLGKTVQLLALLAADPTQAGPTLLVCPMSLVGNWQREAARFTPELRVHVHHGAQRARGEGFVTAVHAADLVLTTYSVAARDAADLAGIDWHRVVLDEAQAIKNAATRQAEAVRALPARHRIAVTGTPVENRLADLWSIMQFANPGLLGPAATFRKRFAEPIERHGDSETAERLRRITGPFVLRRLKTDSTIISDLPEKLEMEVFCNLTAEQAALYRVVVDEMLARIESSDGIERRGLVLATMTRLKQVCNHPAQFLRDGSSLDGRSGKLARLEEVLDEVLAAGEKALLFTQYAEFGGMLRGHLSARFGREVLFLHGGVNKADRDAMVARFQSDGGPALFVLSLKAGGTGLTLTAANHVVHVDRWWNPAVEDQATDRAFRIGQRRRVQVRKFVCAGTVEEKVAALIADKRGLAASVVGSGEQWVTELSTGQLRELFSLEAGAVAQ
ncbi:non-specific serine/threonine protein kinase [Micromonospora phaseoli]|uniref:Non-specific serine/threonine protein kinase n=1 Tax=Micromonospora phaseoli TaxID=1144548 RepID=A0A1H7CAU7_9ACTN|nr:DEAD/DEAH box helicase [Micromonospora phaseoli]PZV97944.1 non-specific serine/threonine protein kinase [Micromonospora phaseoli]GIJ78610.1 helicase HelZ [Micromonospora phaseoli]SEJ86983.1 non-specific serine/threonine protein kinase [Micromonospora phaseoli]